MRSRRARPVTAVVAGGVELVRALGRAGLHAAVVAPEAAPVHLSRFAASSVHAGADELVEALLALEPGPVRPAVLYDGDAALLRLSRARDRLAERFALPLPDPELLEALVDKAAFDVLARRLGLDVPAGRPVRPSEHGPEAIDLPFPLVLKAVPYRDVRWDVLGERAKVLRVADREALERLWPRLASADLDLLAQEELPGDEGAVVSYHVYVGRDGTVLGEFTGRKLRTTPLQHGMSSALVTTADPALREHGAEVVRRLALTGPAKLDFKRLPGGRLVLLEVNARFTLWVEPGAVAGVNLAAIAHAELTGAPLPAPAVARPGVRWIQPALDRAAAREAGVPLRRWLRFALACETNQAVSRDDPLALARRLRRRRAAGRR